MRALAALPAARAEQASLDGRVLGFSLLATVACGLLFGLVPALETSRADLGEGLKQGARTGTGGRRTRRARNLLIVFETALSLVLLAGAGLMMRSFFRLVGTDPGFRREGVLSARLPLPVYRIGKGAPQGTYARALLDRIERLPGAKAAALVSVPPLGALHFSMSFSCQCPPAVKEKFKVVSYRGISPDYFSILGIPMRQGRAFTEADMTQKAVIVNEALARALWPNENPIGKLVTNTMEGSGPWMPVVGVVADIRDQSLDSGAVPQFFLPYGAGLTLPHVSIVVRTAGDPTRFAAVLRRAVRESFPDQPVGSEDARADLVGVGFGAASVHDAARDFRLAALLLASMGMFAVTAYGVTERRREIGIRMALGAAGPDVVRLMVQQSVRPLAAGIAVGIPAALAACRVLESQLYGIKPDDLGTFTTVPFVLAGVVRSRATCPQGGRCGWIRCRRCGRSDYCAPTMERSS